MRKLIPLLLTLCLASPVVAQSPTPQQIEINAQVSYGLSYLGNTNLLNYMEPNTTTGTVTYNFVIPIPALTVNQEVNLSGIPGVTNIICFGISDISNPGVMVNVATCPTGSYISMAPNGFMLMRTTGTASTLYVSNPSTTQTAYISIFIIAN